jgi:D-glycero-D-manno-heptose 1,7-bisphosphate phosphatase
MFILNLIKTNEKKDIMLIILDRDGVINQDSDHYIKSPDEWLPIAGSLAAIAQLNKAGHTVTVATNQSGIGRGYFSAATLANMHEKMHRLLAQVNGHIDDVRYCPHSPIEKCECRKPKPGMLIQLMQQFNADKENTLVIGDALRDIQAAQAMGCKAFLVKTGKGTLTLPKINSSEIAVFADLAEAVKYLLQNKN